MVTRKGLARVAACVLFGAAVASGACRSGQPDGTSASAPPSGAVPTTTLPTTTLPTTTASTTTLSTTAVPTAPVPPTLGELRARFKVSALSPDTKRTAEAITSIFENSTPELQYGYSETLDDGRGVTAGRAGFTSGTGDLVIVVSRYVRARPHSELARFVPALQDLAKRGSDDVSALVGFGPLFAEAAEDAEMRAVQDAVVDELYYLPMLRQAEAVGVVLPLTLAVLYDTAIQHGTYTDPDGLPSLVAETTAAAGRPADGVDERVWLRQFLRVRRQHLEHSAEPSTRAAWAESVVRCDAFETLATDHRWALDLPLPVAVYGSSWTLR